MLPTIISFKTHIFNTEFLILRRSVLEFAIKTRKILSRQDCGHCKTEKINKTNVYTILSLLTHFNKVSGLY